MNMQNAIAGTVKTTTNKYGEKVTEWAQRSPSGQTVWYEHVERHDHGCLNGPGSGGYWVLDYQGIELAKVCDRCRKSKLAHFRPEIIEGYDQSDVDEAIEAD